MTGALSRVLVAVLLNETEELPHYTVWTRAGADMSDTPSEKSGQISQISRSMAVRGG